MIIYKKFFFEAAHFMPKFSKKHKYNKIHGHSYELIIHLNKNLIADEDWIMDFEDTCFIRYLIIVDVVL